MIDSSKWAVIEAGLKCVQGKAIVNSISLKEGEDEVPRAGPARPAATARPSSSWPSTRRGRPSPPTARSRSAQRAYKLLTEKVGFAPDDIIFDANILTVGTGIEEHNNYAVEFIEAVRELKRLLPRWRRPRGGVSNVSFSFRGNDVGPRGDERRVPLPRHPRRARHGHRQRRPARRSTRRSPRTCSSASRTCCSIAGPTPTDRLTEFAETVKTKGKKDAGKDLAWRDGAGRGAAQARPDHRHRRLHRRRRRGGAAEVRAAAARSSKGR